MTLVDHLPALLIIAPLAGAAITFVTERSVDRIVAVLTSIIITLFSGMLLYRVASGGAFRYEIGGWGAPIGIDLVADGPAALFLLLTAVVGTAVTIYATAYFPKDCGTSYGHGLFWTLWLFMWTSLNALFLTGDVFNVYVCLELIGISAVALVTLKGDADALRAGARYLFASMLAAMTYLLGVALLYSSTGQLDMEMLRATLTPDSGAATGLALMVAALVLKTALVPAHFWLPTAHASAPTPVSAALSALVVKASYFAILRLMLSVMPPGFIPGAGTLLGILGSMAIIWGSLQAMRQTRIKQWVAYSTVAQIGYLFIVFPLADSGADVLAAALGGVLLHALSHGLAKTALFLGAGSLMDRFGHNEIARMTGAARTLPVLTATVALAGVTMMGLPPSGGFGSKWQLVSASIGAGQWWWALVLGLGGLLAAAYMFRVLAVLLSDTPTEVRPTHAPVRLEWLPLALAVAALFFVFAAPFVDSLAGISTIMLHAGVTP
ncbi:MAG: proton-conducting transporter membrane subunit [Coriobacteriia bacterium]|nr:proton-conducting transporter membrane subunit [Coriobacteriia bacterium]